MITDVSQPASCSHLSLPILYLAQRRHCASPCGAALYEQLTLRIGPSPTAARKSPTRGASSRRGSPTALAAFIPHLRLCSECEPEMQGLVPGRHHDRARVLQGLTPLYHLVT